jgi:hypothetical protein
VCRSCHTEPPSVCERSQPVVLCIRKKIEDAKIIAVRIAHKPGQGGAATFRSRPVAICGFRIRTPGISAFPCAAVICCSSRGSVRVARRPDVGRRAADVPVCIPPGRLARSTPCMVAGRPHLYLIYIVDQIACDIMLSGARVRRARMYAPAHGAINRIHNIISFFFSFIRGDMRRDRLSMGVITTNTTSSTPLYTKTGIYYYYKNRTSTRWVTPRPTTTGV